MAMWEGTVHEAAAVACVKATASFWKASRLGVKVPPPMPVWSNRSASMLTTITLSSLARAA